jgi:hypothetical protein
MASSLHRLLYLSRAAGPMASAEVDRLLQAARARNRESGLTGALLHYDGRFLQALEGEPQAVAACFERIRRDPRHADVLPLFEGTVGERCFEGWSMRYVAPAGSADRAVAAFLDQLRHDAQPGAVQQALALMQRLAQRDASQPQSA